MVSAVDLTETPGKHDRLDPFAALAAGQAHAKRARVACDEGLAKLVAVVGRAIGSFKKDLKRRRKRCGILRLLVFPWLRVGGDLQQC